MSYQPLLPITNIGAGGGSLLADNRYVRYTGAGAGDTITLPLANSFAGKTPMLIIRNVGSGAVIISRAGADLVDGATTISIPAGSGVIMLCDGVSNWTSN